MSIILGTVKGKGIGSALIALQATYAPWTETGPEFSPSPHSRTLSCSHT